MTTENFVQKIDLIRPKDESELAIKSAVFKAEIMRSSIITKKTSLHKREEFEDEWLYLVNQYNIASFGIATIVLFGSPEKSENHYWFIGEDEADTIGIHTLSKEVHLLDHVNLDYVICKIALDSSHFLESLYYLTQVAYFLFDIHMYY